MRFTEWDEDLAAALAEPFPPEAHQTKSQGGSQITFVSVHHYKTRLNATVGPQGWECRVRLEDHTGKLVCVCSLTILGVTKENVGDEDEEKDSYGTASTNSYSQSFKRTASDFGLGAYLYDKAGRDAATRGRPRPAGASAATSGGARKATQKQMEYLDKLMLSSVFTDIERGQVARKIAEQDAGVVSKAIEWAKEQLDTRKKAQATG